MIIILGAGIIGLSIGYDLLKKGKKVKIFDSSAIKAKSTNASIGMLAPLIEAKPLETKLFKLMTASKIIWEKLQQNKNFSQTIGLKNNSSLMVALNKDDEEKFVVKDCQLDTDVEILIPNDYVSNVEERISLYQQLNKINNNQELIIFTNNLIDRFGNLPNEINILLDAMRLKWIGKEIGFEKIVLKNNTFRGYFTSNKKSKYFESKNFQKILKYLTTDQNKFELKEANGKLILKQNKIIEISEAISCVSQIKNYAN